MTARILVVDDEPANLALLRQILAPEHALVFARSGQEALSAATKHLPALIHDPHSLADVLPGAAALSPAEHRD